MSTQQLELKITGMTCGHCENFVKSVINELEGISNLSVDHKAGKGMMVIDSEKITAEQVVEQINGTGAYHAEIIR